MKITQNTKLALDWTDPSGTNPPQISDLEVVFKNVVNVALGFAGIAFFVLLLVGGFKYMSAGSDPKAIEAARKTLTSAIAGLLIVILSYLVLVFIGTFTGVDLTQFKIVNP
ncbi:MAG: hypothetical protein ABIJ85_02755 [bacterium]